MDIVSIKFVGNLHTKKNKSVYVLINNTSEFT